jgi:hypothetical protein
LAGIEGFAPVLELLDRKLPVRDCAVDPIVGKAYA